MVTTRLASGKAIKAPDRFEPQVDGPLEDDLSTSDLSSDDDDESFDEEEHPEFDPDNPDTDSDTEVDTDAESLSDTSDLSDDEEDVSLYPNHFFQEDANGDQAQRPATAQLGASSTHQGKGRKGAPRGAQLQRNTRPDEQL